MTGGYLNRRGWMRGEVAIWIFALAFAIMGCILLVTEVVGHWVLPVGGVIVLALGLMRYRAETRQKRRNAGDRNE
jgi:Flp pilus assembly protein TadB